jgi:hypothetical protein
MRPTPEQAPILDYSKPSGGGGWKWPRSLQLALVLCLTAGIWCAVMSAAVSAMPHPTPAYAAYARADNAMRQSQPGYVSQPFIGQRYTRRSPWTLPITYVSLGLFILSAAIIVGAVAYSKRRADVTAGGAMQPGTAAPQAPPARPGGPPAAGG